MVRSERVNGGAVLRRRLSGAAAVLATLGVGLTTSNAAGAQTTNEFSVSAIPVVGCVDGTPQLSVTVTWAYNGEPYYDATRVRITFDGGFLPDAGGVAGGPSGTTTISTDVAPGASGTGVGVVEWSAFSNDPIEFVSPAYSWTAPASCETSQTSTTSVTTIATTTTAQSTTTTAPAAPSTTTLQPPSTTTPSPDSPPTAPQTPTPTRATISRAVAAPGDAVTVTGSGFQPGESVTASLHSTPREIGTQEAGANGSVRFTFNVLSDEVGQHRVELSGSVSGSVSVVLTVEAATLPATGFSPLPGLAAALLFVSAGAAILFVRRTDRSRGAVP